MRFLVTQIKQVKIIEILLEMALLADFPESIPGITLNRLCASGMEAVIAGARMIKAEEGDFNSRWCRKHE